MERLLPEPAKGVKEEDGALEAVLADAAAPKALLLVADAAEFDGTLILPSLHIELALYR